jgi:uncharacterized protein (DUF2249 family)
MSALPAEATAAGTRSERLLDVRPVLDKGGDPFTLIMKTLSELASDEALHLVVGFEPVPLYEVMKANGRGAVTREQDGVFHVWFYRTSQTVAEGGPPPERAALLPPLVMDVRDLEPPQPMLEVLQKLVELGPGAQLLVHHHREPVMLYEKLRYRGYDARTQKRGEGDYLVRIAPAWVFAEEAG